MLKRSVRRQVNSCLRCRVSHRESKGYQLFLAYIEGYNSNKTDYISSFPIVEARLTCYKTIPDGCGLKLQPWKTINGKMAKFEGK